MQSAHSRSDCTYAQFCSAKYSYDQGQVYYIMTRSALLLRHITCLDSKQVNNRIMLAHKVFLFTYFHEELYHEKKRSARLCLLQQ